MSESRGIGNMMESETKQTPLASNKNTKGLDVELS